MEGKGVVEKYQHQDKVPCLSGMLNISLYLTGRHILATWTALILELLISSNPSRLLHKLRCKREHNYKTIGNPCWQADTTHRP